MAQVWLAVFGMAVATMQLALHGASVHGVVPHLGLVGLVIVASRRSYTDSLWFALPLGLVLEVGSGAAFGTQLLSLLIFVMITKLLIRVTVDQPRTAYLCALLISATWILNLIMVLGLNFTTISEYGTSFLLRTGVETLYNSALLGIWLAVAHRSRRSHSGYRLPASR